MEHVNNLHETNIDLAINLCKSIEEGKNLDSIISNL